MHASSSTWEGLGVAGMGVGVPRPQKVCRAPGRGGLRCRCTLLTLEEHLAKGAEREPEWNLMCPTTSREPGQS